MFFLQKKSLFLISLFSFLLVVSCSMQDTNEIILSDSLQKPPVYFGFYENGTLLYYQEENGTVTFYTFNSTTQKKSVLGTIDRYFLDTGFTTLLNDRLYFYAGILNSENEIKNTLFSIDLQNQKIYRHNNPDLSLPGINVFTFSDDIVTLKNERDGDIITTYLEFYHTKTDTWEKFFENEFNEASKAGSALYVMYADNEYIYIIQDIYDDGKYESYFIQYDQSFNEMKKILLKGRIIDFIKKGNGRIVELKIFDDYLYLKDLSGNGFLGKIENEDVFEVKALPQFISATSLYHDATPIFFIRESNTIFTLDTSTGNLTEYSLAAKEGHSIAQIFSTNSKILIVAWNDSRLQIQHFSNLADLEKLEI